MTSIRAIIGYYVSMSLQGQHALCRAQLHNHGPVTLKVKGQEVPVVAAALRGQAGRA